MIGKSWNYVEAKAEFATNNITLTVQKYLNLIAS